MRKAQTIRQHQADNIEQVTHSRQDEHTEIVTETTTQQSSDEEVVTTIREYDTSKPVDENTGTPPLARETTQTRRKAETGQQTQTVEQTTDVVAQTEEQTREQVETTIQEDTTERRGLNTWQKILCIIGGVTLLAVVIRLGWQLLKKHL